MKLFSSKINLFKRAEEAPLPASFDALSQTVDAASSPELNPEDFQEPVADELQPETPPEQDSDVVQQLKVKLISVLGKESEADMKDVKKLEHQTNNITAED